MLWASTAPSERSAQGLLAACVQQRLTTPERLAGELDRLSPLRRARLFRRLVCELAEGAQSLSEVEIGRLCDRFGFARPRRQTRRRDAAGRLRYTDCEWDLPDGRVLVLEVDGAFHMSAEQWEDDIQRQRALTTPTRIVLRATAREIRDYPDQLAHDLSANGVPRTGRACHDEP
ncbi:endonuclease domain-containing protein [Nocardioidaceae bacterium]|nr:endonuclease domain-containing protein [Nocardioidaceae bacterium]